MLHPCRVSANRQLREAPRGRGISKQRGGQIIRHAALVRVGDRRAASTGLGPQRGRGMMVSVSSKFVVRTFAGLAALAMAAALLFARGGGGNDSDDATAINESIATGAPPAAVRPTAGAPATVAPKPPSTNTTLPSSTTTTAPPATTTSSPPSTSSANGYVWVPKPMAGPGVVSPGGALTKHLAVDLATAFGLETAAVEAAIAGLELPPEAGGNPEGWLAPGAYQPADPATAQDIVQAMVDRRVAQLQERNVPRNHWHRVLTAASVVESETYNQNEKPFVARVLANRLAGGGPLQMDSIILYPVPEDRVFTTSDERASDQPYNSYRQDGLPPTPICSPDEASLDAFLAPPPGDWWFYVTIDLHTGETRYSVTYKGHQANVKLLRAWLSDHPTP